MYNLLRILFFSVLAIVHCLECPPAELNDDEIKTFISNSPYDERLECVIHNSVPGFMFAVTIKMIDIDGNNGDYLLIKPGQTLQDEGTGKIFTHYVSKERKYVIPSEYLYILFETNDSNEDGRSGFEILYQRIGSELVTTTPGPEGNLWPTPGPTDEIYFRTYLSGRAVSDFQDNQEVMKLKNVIVKMAKNYCDISQIPIHPEKDITFENVHIQELGECPLNWPDRDRCIYLRISLPIHTDPEYVNGYQLQRTQMEAMWRMGNVELSEMGLSEYKHQKIELEMTVWLVIAATVSLAFATILILLKTWSDRIISPTFRRPSDAVDHINDSRASIGSQRPDEHQKFPRNYENFKSTDFDYRTYEPSTENNRSFSDGSGLIN